MKATERSSSSRAWSPRSSGSGGTLEAPSLTPSDPAPAGASSGGQLPLPASTPSGLRTTAAVSPPAPQGSWDCPGEAASKPAARPAWVGSQPLDTGSLGSLRSSLKTKRPQQQTESVSRLLAATGPESVCASAHDTERRI